MTYLDVLAEKSEQKSNNAKEWVDYKEKAKKHWEQKEKEIKSFFGEEKLIIIPFEKFDNTPFLDIPKFISFFPSDVAICDYLDAVEVKCEFFPKFKITEDNTQKKEILIHNPFV